MLPLTRSPLPPRMLPSRAVVARFMQRLSARDGGENGHYVRLIGANATISGGVEVQGWVQDPGENVWRAPIPEGVNMSIVGQRVQLWRGQARQTLARSPTLKYIHANDTSILFNGTDILATYHDFPSVHLVLFESWTASFHRLAKVDPAAHVATLASHYNSKWANSASGSRFYVENALEELDEPGEFYVDALRNQVVLQTAPGDDPNDVAKSGAVLLAKPVELIQVFGTSAAPVQFLSFEGVAFAHTAVEGAGILEGSSAQSADFLTTAAVHVRFARHVSLNDCTIRAVGGYAYWAEQGAYDTSLEGSLLTDLGAGGVRLGRGHVVDSDPSPECEGHVISNNIISDGGFIWQEGCGVFAQNIGATTISHNEIARFRYTGVSTGWTWGYGKTVRFCSSPCCATRGTCACPGNVF